MAFRRHLLSLELECCLIDVFACTEEEKPYTVCLGAHFSKILWIFGNLMLFHFFYLYR